MMKILLFEDDEGVASLTKETLEKNDFQVDWARRGEEGLKKAQVQNYDLILLDQAMPDLTGLETFEKLKNIQPNIIAIIVTGSGNEEIAVRAMKMGVADYIVKSTDMAYLKALPLIIHKAIEQKKLSIEKEHLTKELEVRNKELTAKLKLLETFEKVTLDREKRILELKGEIAKLKAH